MATARRWSIVAVLALLMTALAAAGCGGDDDDGGSAKGDFATKTEGKLLVGSDIPYAPFEFGRAPDYEGFDIDIVNELAKRLELDLEIKKSAFDTIFRDLAQGKFDAVASSTTILPERQKVVDFSDPYFPADQSLMVKEGSDIKTVEDLADGRRVGAQSGTTGAAYAKDETDADVRTYELIDDAFNALQAEQVEAVIADFPVTKYAERSKKDLKVVQSIPTGEVYGIAFPKGSDALREAVNKALDEIKDNGTYTKIYRKWFNAEPPESILRTSGGAS